MPMPRWLSQGSTVSITGLSERVVIVLA